MTISVSPRIGALLFQVTETADLETALWRVLSDYVDIKTTELLRQIRYFESKWKMTFPEFSRAIEEESLGIDVYAYEVEKDFWEWEEAITLLSHYQTLQPT